MLSANQKFCKFFLNSKHFQQEKLNKDLEYLNSSKDDERYTSKVSTVRFTEHATSDSQLVLAQWILVVSSGDPWFFFLASMS